MRRLSIAERTSWTQVRSFGASPSIAVFAVRRKFETVTPGTSTGYCMARKRPGAGALVDGHREDVLAVQRHAAAGDRVLRVAGDRVREGRLAGPVRAHDRVGLARADGQVDPAQDLLVALLGRDGDVQVADLEGGHGSGFSLNRSVAGVDGKVDVDENVVAVEGHGVDGHRPDRRQRQSARRCAGRSGSRAASTRSCSPRPPPPRGRPRRGSTCRRWRARAPPRPARRPRGRRPERPGRHPPRAGR